MLKQRVGTALVLFILFLAALFYLTGFQWSLLMLVVTCLGAWEWSTLIKLRPGACGAFIAIVGGSGGWLLWHDAAYGLSQQFQLGATVGVTIFWAVAVPLWLKYRPYFTSKLFMAAVGLSVLLPTFLALDGLRRISPMMLLAVMFAVWIADTAAYFAGKQFGRHKLAPAVSPGKTWEGVAGAMLGVGTYAVALCIALNLSYLLVPGLILLAALSVLGDLFESLLKRQAGLKDSGKLLPGHGGILDRIDGLTSTLPFALFYFPFYQAILGLA